MLEYIPLVSLAAISLVWAVRLEGKVNVQKQAFIDLEKLINFRFDSLEENSSRRLDRIEKAMNGAFKGH